MAKETESWSVSCLSSRLRKALAREPALGQISIWRTWPSEKCAPSVINDGRTTS
jgi:hypothetical protein